MKNDKFKRKIATCKNDVSVSFGSDKRRVIVMERANPGCERNRINKINK